MANDTIQAEDWTLLLKCKECWIFKEVNSQNWYKHSEGYLWVLGRCKICIKKWRCSERELKMATVRDMDRYYNNPKRREYILRDNKERRKRKWYWYIHEKTRAKIRELWIRPKVCPICLRKWRIIAHHPDYDKRYEIVFCCSICHSKIHSWKIKTYNVINLNTILDQFWHQNSISD